MRDPRFVILGRKLGTSRFDAVGRMAHIWAYCTDKQTYFLTPEVIDTLAEYPEFSSFICGAEVDLAEVTDRGIRIRGTRGRIEWLGRLRKNGKKGAAATKAKWKAKRRPDGLAPGRPDGPAPPGPSSLTSSSSISSSRIKTKEANAVALPPGEQQGLVLVGGGSLPARSDSKSGTAGQKASLFVASYVKAYQTRFKGRPEDLNDPKVRGQIQNLVASYPVDRLSQLVQVYFQMDAKWFGTKGYDFLTFRNNLNKIGQALDSGQDPTGIDWGKVFGGGNDSA